MDERENNIKNKLEKKIVKEKRENISINVMRKKEKRQEREKQIIKRNERKRRGNVSEYGWERK